MSLLYVAKIRTLPTIPINQSLSELLGFTYTLSAPSEDVEINETLDMVRNGSYDMAAGWITITEERAESVAFTYPYYDLGIVFVYRADLAEQVRRVA